MTFSCDRCQKRFTTSDEPVPGRTYRIPCSCGNTIVLAVDEPAGRARAPAGAAPRNAPTPRPGHYSAARPEAPADPFSAALPRDPADDPFFAPPPPAPGRATTGVPAAVVPDVTPTHLRPLVERDPHASPEETTEYGITASLSFDDVLRRARRQGFLAGCVAGAGAAATFAVVTWILIATTPAPHRDEAALAAPAGAPAPPRNEVAAAVRAPASAAAAVPDPRATAGSPPAAPAPVMVQAPRAAPAAARASAPPGADVPAAAKRPAAAERPAAATAPGAVSGRDAIAAEPAAAEAASDAPAPDAAPLDPKEPPDPADARLAPAADPGTASPPAVSGGPPDARKVMAALRTRGEAIDECVALTPGDQADVRGRRFRLVVAVEPSGKVSDVEVDDPEVDGTPLGICLARLAHAMTFSPFEGERVRVELPIRYGRAQ